LEELERNVIIYELVAAPSIEKNILFVCLTSQQDFFAVSLQNSALSVVNLQ
jgi:hypothetical protein